jgi:hypothetical protein
VTAGVVLLALAIGKSDSIRAQNVGFALETFLRDSIGLDAGQLADAQRGNAVSKILPTKSSRDITVFGIIAVHTTRDAYVARLGDFQRIQALRSAQFGMIGDSVTTADFSGISVDESEYRDLRDCKLNDCNFKLPASSMRQFAQSVDWSAPNAKGQVDSIMRVDLQGFVARYRASGNAAMVRYDDNHGTQSSDVFEALLSQSEYLRDHASELRDYLTTYPVHRPEGAHDAMYWSEDKISRLRRTLTLTHVVVYTPPSGAPLIVRKQIYANHYFDGALELVGAFDAPSLPGGPGLYLVSVRRYSFDNLPSGGFLNIRGRVRNQLANLLQSDLEKERKAIEIPSP